MELTRAHVPNNVTNNVAANLAHDVTNNATYNGTNDITNIPLPNWPRYFAVAAAHLRTFCRTVIRKSLAGGLRIRRVRKQLSVRETTALGDRRFVSVIQFERRRFLIGSSPSSITLLSRLPDAGGSGEEEGGTGNAEKSKSEERSGEKN
jgi:hypothetical protein